MPILRERAIRTDPDNSPERAEQAESQTYKVHHPT